MHAYTDKIISSPGYKLVSFCLQNAVYDAVICVHSLRRRHLERVRQRGLSDLI